MGVELHLCTLLSLQGTLLLNNIHKAPKAVLPLLKQTVDAVSRGTQPIVIGLRCICTCDCPALLQPLRMQSDKPFNSSCALSLGLAASMEDWGECADCPSKETCDKGFREW